jgi:hypothetical protein
MKLLLCVTCLNPSDSSLLSTKKSLFALFIFISMNFSIVDLMVLDDQFDMYIIDLTQR